MEVIGDSGGLGGLGESATTSCVDPLATLMGGLASLGAGERGVLAGLLGRYDRERLNEAMKGRLRRVSMGDNLHRLGAHVIYSDF